MICKWLVDVVVREETTGLDTVLYKDIEFEVVGENEYINAAIARGWVEVLISDEEE